MQGCHVPSLIGPQRGFTRAARQCDISQPSLTNAIIRLEQELGGPLFERKLAVHRQAPN
jgi:DNA-binding transcriptional LysR family regulator